MRLLLTLPFLAGLTGLLAALGPRSSPPTPSSASFEIDPTHSTVIFHTRHLGVSEAYGRFNRISDKSEIALDPDPAKCSILVVIEADSVDTNNKDRDQHLRNADFLSAKEFPEIVFESQKVSGTFEALEITGELTFHGVTKAVTAQARRIGEADTVAGYRAGYRADLRVDLRDFEVEFAKKNPGAIGPEVELVISLECVRQ